MPKFSERSKVYPFTTENLAGYMKYLNLAGKKVLSVTSSGDHILNSFYYDADDVTGFDINSLASLFAELKFNAVKKLSFEEFKRYFFLGNPRVMNFWVYNSLREDLSTPCLDFFDNIYEEYDFNGRRLRECKLFNKKFEVDELRIRSNPYLSSASNFERTKTNIKDKKIVLINSNIRDLAQKLESQFDVMFLSNLTDYSQQIFPENPNHLDMFCKEIILPMKRYLNPEGVIALPMFMMQEKEKVIKII
jgi:hypothetical protein